MDDHDISDSDSPRCYSSEDMRKAWVYGGIKTRPELSGPDAESSGDTYCYGTKGYKLSLPNGAGSASLNVDDSLLAIATGNDIHVYKLPGFSLKQVLKGHLTRVGDVVFHPKSPSKLLSASEGRSGVGNDVEDPTIILWQLDGEAPYEAETESFLHDLGNRVIGAVVQGLKDVRSNFKLSEEEQQELSRDFTQLISKFNVKHQIGRNTQISGRVQTSFQSKVYNSNGTKLIYLPGRRPISNSVAEWDVCIWDVERGQDAFTLRGHTDAIMWVGFCPDDKLIASVCWDRSFRIWSGEDGTCLHTFKTKQQNWTGGFSPDSIYFAGTSGDGILWVYNIVKGVNIVSYNFCEEGHHGQWGRTLDWRPTCTGGRYALALGSERGRVSLFEFDGQALAIRQTLELLTDANLKRLQPIMHSFLEIGTLRFFSNAKLAWRCPGAEGLHVYDTEKNTLWRFERKSRGDEESQRSPILLGKGLIARLSGEEFRLWRFPREDSEEGAGSGVSDVDWSKQVGTWRQPGARAAYEIMIEY